MLHVVPLAYQEFGVKGRVEVQQCALALGQIASDQSLVSCRIVQQPSPN